MSAWRRSGGHLPPSWCAAGLGLTHTTNLSCTAFLCAGQLSINASSPTIAVFAAAQNNTVRLLTLRLPGTLSFGSILSQLGLGAAGIDSTGVLSLSNTSLKYVPTVQGSTGGLRGTADLRADTCSHTPEPLRAEPLVTLSLARRRRHANPAVYVDPTGTNHSAGISLLTTVAVSALNIPPSAVSVQVASSAGALAQNVVMQVRIDWAPAAGVCGGVRVTRAGGDGASLRSYDARTVPGRP